MTKAYKNLFLSALFLSTFISISAYSWLGMWIGLEMNLLSIIPLMHNQKNILSSESTIKYFTVQAIASTIILMSVITMMTLSSMTTNVNLESAMITSMNSSLLMKMGMAPFHFWFPEVIEGLDWLNCLLILTWQKLAPMVLLMYNMKFSLFISFAIISSLIVSGLMGVNQVSLRKILAYSSINHMGWMVSTMMVAETIWMIYFSIYSIISINIIFILKKLKIMYLNQLFQSMNSSIMSKMFFILNFLSLSGIPPFLGFLTKWITIQGLVQKSIFVLPTIMIILTLITIYMYIRITISTILMNSNELNWNPNIKTFSFKEMSISLMNFFTITGLILITMMFNAT